MGEKLKLWKGGDILRYNLTPFGKQVKLMLAMNNKTVTWLSEQVKATGINCRVEQVSRCLHGKLHNKKILDAISKILNIERTDENE